MSDTAIQGQGTIGYSESAKRPTMRQSLEKQLQYHLAENERIIRILEKLDKNPEFEQFYEELHRTY